MDGGSGGGEVTTVRSAFRLPREQVFLGWVGAVALVVGASVHAASPLLPSRYSWFEPLRLVSVLWSGAWVPVCVLASAGLGWWSSRARLWPATRREAVGRGLVAAAGVALDVALVPAHGLVDLLAVGALGFLVSQPRTKAGWARVAAGAASGLFVTTGVCYCFTVLKALVFAGHAPMDSSIIDFEHWLTGVQPHRLVATWSAAHPGWVSFFDWTYTRLFHQVLLTTVFLLALGDSTRRSRFLWALSLCYLLGAPLYLVWPALGPVFFEPQTFDYLHSASLQTDWMREGLALNTSQVNEGSARLLVTWAYIACMPSLHIAQAAVMLWAVRSSRLASGAALVFLGLTAVAVVVLGWHYPTDVVMGLGLAAVAIGLSRVVVRLAWAERAPAPRERGERGGERAGVRGGSKRVRHESPLTRTSSDLSPLSQGEVSGGGRSSPGHLPRSSAPRAP